MTAPFDLHRFAWRAKRIAALRHPNLLPMLPLPLGTGLTPLLHGERKLVDFTPSGTFRRFELERVVRLLLDVLCALSLLHDDVEDGVGFVHGGVSPETIYLADDGTARLLPVMGFHMTPSDRLMSTGYVAPELLLGEPADARADLYSVGVMLWEALAGAPLFPDPSRTAVLKRLSDGSIAPLSARPGQLWAAPLHAIAERAIARDPPSRFESAGDLWAALAVATAPRFARHARSTWQDDAPTLLLPPGLRPDGPRQPPSERSVTPLSSAYVTARPERAGSWHSQALHTGIVVLGALILAALLRRPASGDPPQASRQTAVAPPSAAAPLSVAAATEPANQPAATPSALVAPASATPKRRPKPRRSEPSPADYGF